jgi:hypothetical protein
MEEWGKEEKRRKRQREGKVWEGLKVVMRWKEREIERTEGVLGANLLSIGSL